MSIIFDEIEGHVPDSRERPAHPDAGSVTAPGGGHPAAQDKAIEDVFRELARAERRRARLAAD